MCYQSSYHWRQLKLGPRRKNLGIIVEHVPQYCATSKARKLGNLYINSYQSLVEGCSVGQGRVNFPTFLVCFPGKVASVLFEKNLKELIMRYGQLSRYLLQAPSYFPTLTSFLCHVLQEILPACWFFHHSRYLQNIYYAQSTWIDTRDS